MTVEKVEQPKMLAEFRQRLAGLLDENQKLSAKIKENEVTALKLQGAIETLENYNPETMSAPPEEEDAVDEANVE